MQGDGNCLDDAEDRIAISKETFLKIVNQIWNNFLDKFNI
jgi:hypothetical protein